MTFVLSLVLSTALFQAADSQETPIPITAGQEITGSVTGDGVQEFVIQVEANACVHGVLLSRGGDVAVRVDDPASGTVIDFDNFAYEQKEAFGFKVLEDGSYPITVFSGNGEPAEFYLYVGFNGPLGETPAERVQHYIQMQPPSYPGNAVALIQDGIIEVIGARGQSRNMPEEPLTVTSPFVSRTLLAPMVASAIYLLDIQDELGIHTDVRRVLPWFHDYPKAIGIRHLLNGSSGLPSVTGIRRLQEWNEDTEITPAEARSLLRTELLLDLSTRYKRTTDSDVFLLLEILSVETGLDYDEALRKVLFEPLGMPDAHLVAGDGLLPQVSASIEEVAIWAAAMQTTMQWDWSIMQSLVMHKVLERYAFHEPWYFYITAGESFMILETSDLDEIHDYSGVGVKSMVDEPWPWVKPHQKMGKGRRGGRSPLRYRAGEDSPRKGQYYSELLDMVLTIDVVDRKFVLARSSGAEWVLQRSWREGRYWEVDGVDWLSLRFDSIFDEKARKLILHTKDTQVEFLRLED